MDADESNNRREAVGILENCAKLSSLTMPTLVMHGSNDKLVPPNQAASSAHEVCCVSAQLSNGGDGKQSAHVSPSTSSMQLLATLPGCHMF